MKLKDFFVHESSYIDKNDNREVIQKYGIFLMFKQDQG